MEYFHLNFYNIQLKFGHVPKVILFTPVLFCLIVLNILAVAMTQSTNHLSEQKHRGEEGTSNFIQERSRVGK